MIDKFKKYGDFFFVVFFTLIIYKLISNYTWFFSQLKKLKSILAPFMWGIMIALILNFLLEYIRTHFKRTKAFSLVIVYMVFISFMTLVSFLIIPQITRSISDLAENLPVYFDNLQKIFNTLMNMEFWDKYQIKEPALDILQSMSDYIYNYSNDLIKAAMSKAIDLTGGIAQFLVGVIISAYMLYEKDNLKIFVRKFMSALMEQKQVDFVVKWGKNFYSVFKDFFIGKALDSFIIGIMAFVGLYFLRVPYITVLAMIIGITNMIPYVGPFIGAVPAILLTFVFSPIKAVWTALFILALQQFDGNILGPKILGGKMGIRPLYIILAIFIGGGYFGMFGMLIGVPVFKILSMMLDEYIEFKRRTKKSLNL